MFSLNFHTSHFPFDICHPLLTAIVNIAAHGKNAVRWVRDKDAFGRNSLANPRVYFFSHQDVPADRRA
jgi:hypothetical protein